MDDIRFSLNQPYFKRIVDLLPSELPFYLVGGAVRDALLNRPSYDLDFVTAGEALEIARSVADKLGGAYFPLDTVRNVARILLKPGDEGKKDQTQIIRVDISNYQGLNLIDDLKGRDFTINAMALDGHKPDRLIDPLGGAADLVAKRLRACSASSFQDDPVRILRAVRFSVNLKLKMQGEVLKLMRDSISELPRVSAERIRDELFRILILPRTATSLRILDELGALELILPEVCALKNLPQSAPHIMDTWNHTLDTVNWLENILEALSLEFKGDKVSNLVMGMVSVKLGRYRPQLSEHLSNALNADRPHRGLIFLAGLYHDVGKVSTQKIDDQGEIKFIGHEQAGSKLAETRGQALKLSNVEISRLVTIIKHHMRPALLAHLDEPPSRKAVYRFFRDTGVAGIDICVLSLADLLATYGQSLPQDRWERQLEVVRALFSAWWENRAEQVVPPGMIDGDDLMKELGLMPGPMIGYLIETIREAQVSGEIHNRQEAIKLARSMVEENKKKKRTDQ